MKYLIKEYRLTNIANAIRRRTGIDREIILSEMPELIESIFTNDIYPNTLIDKDTDLLQYYIEEESLKAIANAIRNKIASTDLMTIEQMPELIESFVFKEPSFKVTYNANGGSFTNNNTINEVEYTYSIDKIVKTSKTPNVSDDGLTADTTTGYGNSVETTDVITIPGSKSLEVTITYQTEAGARVYDWVSLYDSSITPSSTNYNSSISGQLGGKTKKTETFTIPGDTVQIYFNSDFSTCNYYGYYATVTGTGISTNIKSNIYEEPINAGNAFCGWYTDQACTDGNEFVLGESTNDITVYAKWEEKHAIMQEWRRAGATADFHAYKNTITKVTFMDTYALPNGFDTTAGLGPWDVSEAQNGSVMAYMIGTEVFICSNIGGPANIIANEECGYMFQNFVAMTEIVDAGKLDISNVTGMHSMFDSCEKLTSLDVSNWDTSNVTDMGYMFYSCENLTSLDVSNWDTSNVVKMSNIFDNCKNLTGLDVSNWDTSNVTDMGGIFDSCEKLTSLDVSNWDTSNVTNMISMFAYCSSLTTLGSLNVGNWDTSKVTTMSSMFFHCNSLTTLDVSNWDTSKVTNMSQMFCGAYNAPMKLVSLDAGNWDTGNVTDMNSMFNYCSSLETLNVSNWDTKNVTNMMWMFYGCEKLISLNVSGWDTGNVTNMRETFDSCSTLKELDVSNWDTGNVTNMVAMFNNCSSLETLDVSNWDTKNVTDMYLMFSDCSALKELDVSNWNTSKVTDMSNMFFRCNTLKLLDFSSWDTSSIVPGVKNNHGLSRFAAYCPNLTTIILGENFGQVETIPSFVGYIDAYTTGMFYVDSSTSTTVIGANDVMQTYDWAGDRRTVTHFDSLYFLIDGYEYEYEYGMTLGEWCDSEYNTEYYCVMGGDLYDSEGGSYVAYGYGDDHIITPGERIYLEYWCCFIEGTQIATSLNGDTQSIETLKEGDLVVSYNIETKENYLAKVKKLVTNTHSISMAKVYLDNGTILEMTNYHPLYTIEGFKSITDKRYPELKIGNILPTFNSEYTTITNIELYKNEKPITTYTLDVIDLDENIDDDTTDNYYANGIIAHNVMEECVQ